MTGGQKIIYLAVIPILAAAIGGVATYYGAPVEREQLVITGEAAQAAKDGKLTIEIVRSDNTDYSWAMVFAFPLAVFGFAACIWAMIRE